jgi:predicted DsbA family dithiol-disulfide isomerase
VLVVSLALVGGLAAAWPPAEGPPVRPATAATPPVTPPGGTLEVVVFSDYECPFCAQEHARLKTLLAGRSDVRVSHRHFPLDQSCNRLIKRPMHQSACQRARAAVCAEAQGRLEQMDDALFADQREGLDVVGLAGRLGLDLDRFRDCLGSPEAAARVAADVEAGMTVGVRATPTYVIGGVAYPGQFPVALLPPTAAR